MTKLIPLTRGQSAIVDDEDHEWLSQWKWYFGPGGYAARGIHRNGRTKTIFLHRVLSEFVFGEIPARRQIDHCNGDRLNCTRANLRVVTNAQNQQNALPRAGFSSTYRGVYWKKAMGKWCAKIGRKHLGYFIHEIDAAKAWNAAAILHFGEFARLNEVPV